MAMAESRIVGSSRGASPGAQGGFTLLELMIVVAIVAILAAIAINSYGNATRKSNRAAAQTCLLQRSQFLERFYANNMAYDQTPAGATPVLPACQGNVMTFYDNGTQGPSPGGYSAAPSATTYSLELRPKGSQLKDTVCGTSLTIDQTGLKSPTTAGCWP